MVENSSTSKSFADLGVCEPLQDSLKAMKFKSPTDIQVQSIPHAIEGRDIIGIAKTGSGKTAAFAIPVLQDLLEQQKRMFALVLAPVRELAVQIAEQFEAIGSSIGVRCAVVVGGVDMGAQAIALSKRPHIVVGTPGRIVDHLENTKGFNLRSIKYLIMDEADRLLGMDFEVEIDKILKALPKERRSYLFSATMTSKVEKLQRAALQNPVKVEVDAKYSTVDTCKQQYLFVPEKHKDCYLVYSLNELAGHPTMVFVSTCAAAQRLALLLRNLGFPAIPIHGQMTQPKRLGALNKFKSKERTILICTDVASRGLDIPSVDVVMNFDVPTHSKDYIHRIGRTARAGRSGLSITFVSQYTVPLFQKIETLIGKKLDAYNAPEEAAMLLLERVAEAQRLAAVQMRESDMGNKKRKSWQDGDEDEDGDPSVSNAVVAKPKAGKGKKKARKGKKI